MSRVELPTRLRSLQGRALLVALIAGAASAWGYTQDTSTFYEGWLIGFLFWLALPLGSLALVMLHHMTGGAWGFAIRRLLEAAMGTLPLLALAFLPIAFGMEHLYGWSLPGATADPVIAEKSAYLNEPFFLARAAGYFALWSGLAFLLNRLSDRYDRLGERKYVRRMRAVSGPGIALYGLAMTFASVDWAMSLEPHWFSTIYGVMFIVGQGRATLAFAIIVSLRLAKREPFSRWLSVDHFHDLGKLMFAFVMLWAYVAYSQYLIIWSGNLAEETPWYLARSAHGWDLVAMVLIATHFAVPFVVLLSKHTKRNPRALAGVAMWVFGMRLIDLYWLIVPAFHPEGLYLHWMHLTIPVALGGLWVAYFIQRLKGRPLISLQDARLETTLEQAASAKVSVAAVVPEGEGA